MTKTFQIAIVGPECSGKTTLAQQLGNRLDAPVVPETARNYLSEIGRNYNRSDVDEIAKLQSRTAQDFLSQDPQTLIHDTEILTIKIWQEEKWGSASGTVLDFWKNQSFDLYLLCYPDLPWEDDGLRENPGDRDRLFEIYKKQLMESGAQFSVISGKGTDRLQKAMKAISDLRA